MECSQVRELLSPMSDREIAADELRTVEEHLRTCRECAFQSSMIVGLKRLLGRWDGVHASERFRANVLDRVRREPSPKRTSWLFYALGGGGLAAVVIVVLALAVALPVAPEGRGAPVDRAPAAATETHVDAAPVVPAAPAPPPDAPREAAMTRPAEGSAAAGAGVSANSAPVGQFRVIERAVHIDRPGSFPALASLGDVVSPGVAVRSSDRGGAKLALLAGLFMSLERSTHVVYAEGDFDCELRAGRALICTKDRAKRPRPYRVRSADVTVELRDRAGALVAALERLPGGALRVLVAEGEAALVCPGGERSVGAGLAVTVSSDGGEIDGPAAGKPEALERLRRWGRQ